MRKELVFAISLISSFMLGMLLGELFYVFEAEMWFRLLIGFIFGLFAGVFPHWALNEKSK